MSNENDNPNNNSKKPDYYVQLAKEGRHGKEQIYDVGVVWKSEANEYITGPTAAGRIILQPREERERLQKLRAERQETKSMSQTQEPGHEH